jgi:uncharacterized SAM-binding protein YcdF (DUF218 family)
VLAVALQVVAGVALLVLCAVRERLTTRRRRSLWAIVPLALLLSLALSANPHIWRKWLARFAMPHGWFFLILLGAAAWLWWRGRRREATVATAVFVLYTAAGNVWVSQWLVGKLEAGYQAPEPGAAPFDAVVVLGGGSGMTPSGRPQLSPSGDRIAVAARLYHQGLAERLVCSGSSIAGVNRETEQALGEDVRALLGEMGVPSEIVVELSGPKSTSEELAALGEVVGERGWQRVGLLTSAWHLPRAMRLAERARLDVVPIPADFRSTSTLVTIIHVLPSSEGFGNLRLFLWEVLGMAMGR